MSLRDIPSSFLVIKTLIIITTNHNIIVVLVLFKLHVLFSNVIFTIVFHRKHIISILYWLLLFCFPKGLGAGAGCFGSLEPEPEPEPEQPGKKSGAGAAKKLAGSSALQKDKNMRKLYFSYSSLAKILSFYG